MIPEPAATEKKHFMGYPHHISLVTSSRQGTEFIITTTVLQRW